MHPRLSAYLVSWRMSADCRIVYGDGAVLYCVALQRLKSVPDTSIKIRGTQNLLTQVQCATAMVLGLLE